MASSRWKRFAFFDRYTLNIPNEVLEDVIPRSIIDNNSNNATTSTTNTVGGVSSTTSTTGEDNGEIVSLVVTTAGLPLATRLSHGNSASSEGSSKPGQQEQEEQQQQAGPQLPSFSASSNNKVPDQDEALGAMWSSLVTCSTINYKNAVVAEEILSSMPFPNMTTMTTTLACGDDGGGETMTGKNTTTTMAAPTTNRTAMDGLVLAFVSSPKTDFVHCVDLTVRCNPPLPTISSDPTMTASATEESSTAVGGGDRTTGSSIGGGNERELVDMDGWRGYFTPFGGGDRPPQNTESHVTATRDQEDLHTIRDLAVCRIMDGTNKQTSQHIHTHQQQHNAVHLACLSRNQLVAWEDPHLSLSCRRPLMAPQHMPLEAILWKMQVSATTSAADGDFTCVSLLPGIVAIGTAKGAVLIYVYNPYPATLSSTSTTNSTTNAASATTTTTTTSAAGSKMSDKNNKKTFRRYLRIPPPISDQVQVVSVKVCPSRHENKTSVFVVYNRRSTMTATTTNNTSSTATTNPTSSNSDTTGNNNNSGGGGGGGGSSAGICCFDIPSPSMSNINNLSPIYAPSSRHDLDGRYVASRRLVDAGSTRTTAASAHYHHHHDQNKKKNSNNTSLPTASSSHSPSAQSRLTVARPDGLYTFSQSERVSVSPIDGNKLTVAMIPHALPSTYNPRRQLDALDQEQPTASLGYALLASTDDKSGRDAVDVYDSTNKVVAFHLLLSPGHRAVRAAGVSTPSTKCSDGTTKGGRSSAVVLTSGGSLVTLTEKRTMEKVDLLVKKNLYSAAVVVAYSDPSFPAAEISILYRRYAEHLYRKGDMSGAVDQYIHTIGSLESSHVIFRFLDAPKIPLLVKYLNKLRERGYATPVHEELLRTCYLKLNDAEAAEAIASSSSTVNRASLASVLSNLTSNPKEALATICALEAPEAVDILVIHGASLVRVLPQETAGVVIALCVGTFSPRSLAATSNTRNLQEVIAYVSSPDGGKKVCEQYPVELFASAFIEQPKMLRLILAHSNRSKCPLTPALRRTLLELTLEEWNLAKRTGDVEALKLRHKEAIASLTDSHSREIGDYDALVICQMASFEDGQLLLYERLCMTPMLLERYAKEGTEKARRQMMAMCQSDPEILPEVLGYFVAMASDRLSSNNSLTDDDYAEETEDLLDDIQSTLALARRQGAAPPVRIARILAGEGTGQFSHKEPSPQKTQPSSSSSISVSGGGRGRSSGGGGGGGASSSVPLSVALEYLGSILEESRHEGDRLRAEVEEYNDLCNSMEHEIESLLRTSRGLPPPESTTMTSNNNKDGNNNETTESTAGAATRVGGGDGSRALNIDELYARIRQEGGEHGNSSNTASGATATGPNTSTIVLDNNGNNINGASSNSNNSSTDSYSLYREAFWREMNQSDGSHGLDTIARFFAKGVIR